MCDLLTYASYIVWLELIVASYPVRVIADGFPLSIQVFSENRTADRLDEKSLPLRLITARFQNELAATRRNDGVE